MRGGYGTHTKKEKMWGLGRKRGGEISEMDERDRYVAIKCECLSVNGADGAETNMVAIL